ncbi:iron complex outermembrane recepter protein [Flavobacterium fryxellicola]|uniref:TonB-dependent receptor-like beta-barrel domain-containing protein n=1 Tax=Flavobacterium fryxellicola TaxID=249352 RepID=A0A167VA98_9FLAO|nr:hypothetical protein FBFR_13350 [Flavobacterium fryxellicola]SHN79609.1 iron complex outermembrane recepter protein [Flavobacterium fryxellicola]
MFGGIENSYGAVINRITKKPFDTAKTAISYTTGSYGFNRITADVNTPLKEDKSVLLRTNVALQTQDSWQDAGFSTTNFIAPSLFYKVDDRLSLSFDADIYQYKGTPSNLIFVGEIAGVDSFDDLNFDNNRSFNNNQLFNNNFVTNAFAKAEYKLSSNWKSTTLVNYGKTNQESIFPIASIISTTEVEVELGKFDFNVTTQQIQQNFNGSFKLGSINNRLLLGLDYLRYNTFLTQAYPGVFETVSLQGPRLSLTQQSAADFFDGATVQNLKGKLQTYSAYASNVVDFNDKLHLLLSLRLDHFDNDGEINYTTNENSQGFKQTSLAPRLGLSYEIIDNELSLFGNYNSGFVNQQGVDVNGNTFDPEKASQIEGGIKWEAKSNIVNATLSYYDINVNNIVRGDINNPAFNIQNGNVVSRGLELDLAVNPFMGFNIIMGYAYNDSEITKGELEVEGNRLSRNPEHQANLYANYEFQNTLKGFSLGLGGNYGSETFTADNNQFKLNSYKILNANANYRTGKFSLGIRAENLGNEEYFSWNGQAYTQLRILGNLTLNF